MPLAPGVEALVERVREIRGEEAVRKAVEERVSEFLAAQEAGPEKWFEELTYCLLTAYSSARMGYRCVAALTEEDRLASASLDEIRGCLREQGHRFADARAVYIVAARAHAKDLKGIIQGMGGSTEARSWLVGNIRGLGLKEASHFLRNVGYLDLGIIDRHIISHMVELNMIPEAPKSLTPRRYTEYERMLGEAARELGMPLGEMDLYLWSKKSGEVLK